MAEKENTDLSRVRHYPNSFGRIALQCLQTLRNQNKGISIVAKNPNIKLSADGATLYFEHKLPNQIPRGHAPRKSGAGIHADKRLKRKRGNQQKRQWLDSED